jgi:hypothetical protein
MKKYATNNLLDLLLKLDFPEMSSGWRVLFVDKSDQTAYHEIQDAVDAASRQAALAHLLETHSRKTRPTTILVTVSISAKLLLIMNSKTTPGFGQWA